MSISDNQKLDFLWKKLGYGATKTDVNSIKNATNEAIPSPLLLDGNNLWTDAYQIPTLIPTASSHIVEIYDDSGNGSATVETIEDTTASSNRSWKTGLTNWIPPQFGSTYQVKVYIAPSGTATPQSTGTQVFAAGSGNNDEWFFDYQSGVLNFIGDNLPAGIDGNEIFVAGARYIGKLGNRFTALYADSADISHAYIDSADIIAAYIDSADILHAIIDSADITLGRIGTAYIDSADIVHAFIDSADIGHARITHLDADSAHVYGRLTVGGDLIVDGNATIKSASGGNINLGDSNTDNIVFTADVNSNIRPNVDDAFDLGDSQQQWRNIYIDGAAYIDSANIDHAYIDSADVGLLNITGKITGPASFVIDPAAVGDNTGRVIILGDLQVDGTETTVNSTTVTINDKNIVLADSAPDAVWTDGAGITVAPGLVGAKLKYDQASDRWVFNRDLSHFDSGGALYFDSGIITYITSDSATIKTLYSTYANIDSADITLARITGLTADSAHVTGNLTVGGDLTVSGNATIKSATGGNIYLGDSNDDNIVFSGDINSHLIPNVNVTFDLGTDSQRWRDIYLSGQSIYLGALHLIESNGEFVVKKPDGSLTNIRASFIRADSAQIGQLRVDSASITRLSGSFGNFDSMDIASLRTKSIDLGDGTIVAGLGDFENAKLRTSNINVGDILTKLPNDSIGGTLDLLVENVRITSNNLLSGGILTLGSNDSISSTQDLKYGLHTSATYGHTVSDGFLTAKEPIYDSGYYRFSVDKTNDVIKGTNVGFKFGVYPLTPKGQYTQVFPFASDSNTLPFYGLEFNKDTQVLTSTAHTNIFKTSFTKDSAALQGDSSFALRIISSADSDVFSVQRQGKVTVTNNITIDGNVDLTGELLQNGSPFTGGGLLREVPTTGKAYYITGTDKITAPISSFLSNYNAYGHVGIQKNNPKYHMDIAGNFSVSADLDSFGSTDLAYVINPAGASLGLYDDSDKARLSFISNQAITRGGYFTSANYRFAEMGLFSTAFGDNTRAKGVASVAMGQQSHAEGANTIAIGNRSRVEETSFNDALVIGSYNIIHGGGTDGDFTAAIGYDQRVSGRYSVAYGSINRLHGQTAGVFGYNNIVGDSDQLSTTSAATGAGSFVFGSGNKVLKQQNIVLGIDNEAMNGGTNLLIGKDNYSRAPSGSNLAIGFDNTLNATNALTIGRRITIDSGADGATGFNLNPGVSMNVASERIMSIQGGNVIIGADSDKFSNHDGNLYVTGDVVIRGSYLTEGAPGVLSSGVPFIDNGVYVEMTQERNVIIGKSATDFALGIQSRENLDSGRGLIVQGKISTFNPGTFSDIFDSGGANYGNEHSILSYVPRLGTFIAGAMDPTDWNEYLSNGRIGYHAVALGQENIAAGYKSIAIGAENKIYRGVDSDLNALSAKGSQTVFIGHQNQTDNSKSFVGNQNYVFGRENQLSGNVTNNYIIGKLNVLDSYAQSAFIIGQGNTAQGNTQEAYIIGTDNVVDSNSIRNYIIGDNISVNRDAKNNFLVGRQIALDSLHDSNSVVFWMSDPILGVNDASLNNTRMSIGRLPKIESDGTGVIRKHALTVAGNVFLDSGSEIFIGSKTIKGFLGFSEPTLSEPIPAGFGDGALIGTGIDSIQFDYTIGAITNVARVKVPYDHLLYKNVAFEADSSKAVKILGVPLTELTTISGDSLGEFVYFADPIDSFQFALRRDSHGGPPVTRTVGFDSNFVLVDGFDFGESGDVLSIAYTPPIPPQVINPDLDIGGDLTVKGKHVNLSVDSQGVIWQKGDLRFTSNLSLGSGATAKTYRFDSAGFTTSDITSNNLTIGRYKTGDAFENYGVTVLHDSDVRIGGMSFDSFVARPQGLVIPQIIDFLDTDYVQARVFVSSFFRHDENALYYYPESDGLPLVNTVLIGYKPGGNPTGSETAGPTTRRPSDLTSDQYGLNVAARSASGAINIVTSASIGQNGYDQDGNRIGTIDLNTTSPIIVDNATMWPTPGFLKQTNYIDGDYIRSQAFDQLGGALVRSFVDSAYILSAANDSSEWQRREKTLFFGTYPSVRDVNVGIRTDRPRRVFDVAGAVEFRDSALIGGALTANGRALTSTGVFNYLFDSSWLQVVDSDDLLQPDRRGFLGGGTFANVAQAITDADAAFSQGIIVQTSLDNPPGEGDPTENGKIKLRGFEIFKLDSLGNRINLKWGGFKPGPLTNFQFDSYTEAYYTPEAGIAGNIVIDRNALDSADINVIFRERDVYYTGSSIKIAGGTDGDSAAVEALGQTLTYDRDHTFVSIIDPEGAERELVENVDFTFDDDSTITINDSAAWMILGSTIKVSANAATLNSRLDVFGPTVLGQLPTYSLSGTPDISTTIKGTLIAEEIIQLTGDSSKIIVGTSVDIDSQGIDIKEGNLVIDGVLTGSDSYGIRIKNSGMIVEDGVVSLRPTHTTGTSLLVSGDSQAAIFSGGIFVDSLAQRVHIDSNVLFTFGPSINGGFAGFDSQVARVVDSNYIGERIADVWSFYTDSAGIQSIFYRRGDSNGMVVIGHPTNVVEGDSNTKFFVSNGNAVFNHAPANQPGWDVTTQTTTDVVPDFGNSPRHGNTFKGSRMMWIPERGAFRAGAIDGTTVKWSDPEVGKSSVGIGYNTLATDLSVAIGFNSQAGKMDPAHEIQETNTAVSIGLSVAGVASSGIGVGHTITHDDRSTGSISIGHTITNTGNGSDRNVLVGHTVTSTGSGDDNVAVGYNTSIGGNASQSVVVGTSSSTSGNTGSVAVGATATAKDGGVAIGISANANSNSTGVAVGRNVTVTRGGVAIGRNTTKATISNAVAIGNQAQATTSGGATAIGSYTTAKGGTAIGYSVTTDKSAGVAVGTNVRAYQGTALGKNSYAHFGGAMSLGSSNTVNRSGTAIGQSNTVGTYGGIAVGSSNIVSGSDAFGSGNVVSRGGMAFGQGNRPSPTWPGHKHILFGATNSSSGKGTQIIVGQGNTGNSSAGRGSVILGIGNQNNTISRFDDLENIILGIGNTNNNASVIVGRYNTGNRNVHIFGDYNTSSSPDGNSGYIFGHSSTITRNGFLYGSGNAATDNGYAFGSALTVSNGSYAYGSGNTSSNIGIAFGKDNTSVDGLGTIVFGIDNTGASGGLAFGSSNNVSNEGIAFGAHNTSSALDAVALGHGAVVSGAASVVIGVGTVVGGSNKTVSDTNTFAVVGDNSLKVGIGLNSVNPLYRMEIGGHLNIPSSGDYYRHGKILSDYITQDLITEAYVRNHADSDYIEGTIDLQYLRETISPAFFFASNTTTNDLEFTGSGSVGIGRANTNSSRYKLDVDGSINYTGKLYLDGDVLIPSKDSLNDVYITHQTVNYNIGPDSAEEYFDSAYVRNRQEMFGFTTGQVYEQVIDNNYINSRVDTTLFLDSSEAQELIDDAITENVAFKLDDVVLSGYNVTSFEAGSTLGVKVGINKPASVFVDPAFISQGVTAELQVDGNVTIENGNLHVGEDNGTSSIFINGERLENNTTFDATSVLGQTTYTLANRIVVDVGGNIGTIPTPTFDMEIVGSLNIGSRTGKDAELLIEGENILDIFDSAYVQERQIIGIDSGDVELIVNQDYVRDFADSDYIRTVPDSAFIESFISRSFIRSNADSDYILSAADSAYVLSIADSAYVEGIADSNYIKGFIDQAYIRENADSLYVKTFIDQAYIRENADSLYVKTFIDQAYIRSNADSSYVLSIADSAYVQNIARGLVDSAYILNVADSAYVLSAANSTYVQNIIDSAHVNLITGIGTREIDFGSNKIIYSNSYAGTSTRPNATSYSGFFSVLSSTNKAYVTLQGDYKELALLEDIDSAYVQARIVPEGVDSAAVEAMVDSAYVLARSPQFDYINIIDSAYVNARVSTVDSAQVLAIIDSDYILSITGSGGGSGSGTGGGSLVGYSFIATAGQTVFSGSDIEGGVLSYDATTATIVTANGITLTKGVDYTHTDSSNLTFTEARDSGDEISIFTTKAAADAGSTGSTGTTTTSVTVGTATIFDRTIHSNNFKSIEYTVHMEDSSLGHTQITKLLATYNKSQVFSTQYGTVSTFAGDSDLGNIDVIETGGQIAVRLTKASGTGTVKVVSNKTVVN